MIKSYFIISIRYFLKNKIFSLINIIGLAIGMSTCLLILQYVNFELSFDRFHDNREQIYRVINYRYQNGVRIQHGPITYPTIWTLFYTAVFILVIAWINYINLTTSKVLERAKEVGLRKTVGAHRRQLMFQLLTESFLINVMAFLLAITLVQIIQPLFNQLVDQKLSLLDLLYNDFALTSLLTVFTAIFITGMLLSGFYPAFILSSYHPATVLKGKFQRSSTGGGIRRVLVVFQFVASVTLISGTLLVFKQLRFIQEKDMGINLESTMVIRGPGLISFDSTYIDNTNIFKEELKKHASIKAAATSNRIPGQRLGRAFSVKSPLINDDRNLTASLYNIDFDFLETYQLNLLAASVQNIVGILSVGFMKLIIIAGLIAIPLAYFGVNSWLDNFTYKMSVPWWAFVLPILMILVIAFFSIGLQTIRAANNNPVEALRQE